jgi:hypothetical protein
MLTMHALNKSTRINLMMRPVLTSMLCLLALLLASVPVQAESGSSQIGSTSSGASRESSLAKKHSGQPEDSQKSHRTVLIPDCSSEQGQNVDSGSSHTTIALARFIRLDQVKGIMYLTYEVVGGDILPQLLSFEDQGTRNQLNRIPMTTTYEVKPDRGRIPKGLISGDLVDLEISPRIKHMTKYTYFPGTTGANEEYFRWCQTIDENPSKNSHPVDASIITSVKKSSAASANPGPSCLLKHKQRCCCDSSSEYIFSDGTIVVTEWKLNQHQLLAESGILSPANLDLLKDAIAACNFENMAIDVCCDHPQFNNLLAGGSANGGDPLCEYLMDARCQAIFFTGKFVGCKLEDRVRKFKPAIYAPQNRAAEISLLQKLAELRQSILHRP